jgi:hypothetical protein
MRWSEAGYLSQFVLTHALRQASVSLIFDVRSIRSTLMKRHWQTKGYRTPADVVLLAVPPRIFSSSRIDRLGFVSFPWWSREQTRRPDPTPTNQPGAASGPKGVLRISRFGCGAYAQSAQMTTELETITRSPNKAMERSRLLVTDRAIARSAPSSRLAHLAR